MARQIIVYMDLAGKTYLIGRLWINERKGVERASFEYAGEWLNHPFCFSIEPALSLAEGRYHTDKPLFGSLSDSAPDRWGRTLMERKEARQAKHNNRKARKLKESDYLLMVDDRTRQGALRFATSMNGPFSSSYQHAPIPPLINLKRLLNASEKIVSQTESEQDIRDVMEPGSSLGGARPKASVTDKTQKLLIAKFPSPNDQWDVELWEFLSLRMAKKAGIHVPNFCLKTITGRNILLLERFDRTHNLNRVPFLSAMAMLGASDGETGSYLEIGEVLMEHGANPQKDLIELWRRIVFNIMISNVDDHLRNHGFLYNHHISGWQLSPLYDLEPAPEHIKSRFLRTNIDFYNNAASLDLAYEVAEEFGLKSRQAKKIAKEVANSVNQWDKEADQFGVKKQEKEFMSSAFEHDNLKQAL